MKVIFFVKLNYFIKTNSFKYLSNEREKKEIFVLEWVKKKRRRQ